MCFAVENNATIPFRCKVVSFSLGHATYIAFVSIVFEGGPFVLEGYSKVTKRP